MMIYGLKCNDDIWSLSSHREQIASLFTLSSSFFLACVRNDGFCSSAQQPIVLGPQAALRRLEIPIPSDQR